jgi:hypothetical protein
MLEVTGGSMAVVTAANNTDWPAVYAASRLAASNAAEAKRLMAECAASSKPLRMSSMYAQPFLVQVGNVDRTVSTMLVPSHWLPNLGKCTINLSMKGFLSSVPCCLVTSVLLLLWSALA